MQIQKKYIGYLIILIFVIFVVALAATSDYDEDEDEEETSAAFSVDDSLVLTDADENSGEFLANEGTYIEVASISSIIDSIVDFVVQ